MFKGGLQLEDEAPEFVEGQEVFICQAEGQPPFKLKIRRLPVRRYKAIFAKLQRVQGAGFRAASREAQKVDREYLEEVIEGWSGLTIPNWREVVSDGKAIRFRDDEGKDITDKKIAEKFEIEFDLDYLVYVYENSWPDTFANPIFQYVKEGAEKADSEEGQLKKSS